MYPSIDFLWSPRHSELFAVESVPVPGSFAVRRSFVAGRDHLRPCTDLTSKLLVKSTSFLTCELTDNFV